MIGKRIGPGQVAQMIGFILRDGPVSVEDIAKHAGVAIPSLRRWLNAMRSEGLIYVSAWDHNGRKFYQLWSWGASRDARKPKLGRTEIQRRYRAKNSMLELMHALAGPVKEAA